MFEYYKWDNESSELVKLEAESTNPDTFKIDAQQLENWDGRLRCKDCGAWVWGSQFHGKIRHSSRCCTDKAQPVSTFQKPKPPKPIKRSDLAKVAADHRRGACVGDDAIFNAYEAGYLSMSEAMNSDF